MERELVCINCPMGCRIKAVVEDGEVKSIVGNTCFKGAEYAKQELIHPMRMVTALVRVKGETAPLPVKTRTAIPKELIFDILGVLKETEVEPPIGIGDVVVENVCGTGVDVIASANR